MGTDQCPLLGVERCPLLRGSKYISSMVKSIGASERSVVQRLSAFRKGPLLGFTVMVSGANGIPQTVDRCESQQAVTSGAHILWLSTNIVAIKGQQQKLRYTTIITCFLTYFVGTQ